MLAHLRDWSQSGRVSASHHRRQQGTQLSGRRVDLAPAIPRLELWVGEELFDTVHSGMRQAGGLESLLDVLDGTRLEHLLDELGKHVDVGHPLRTARVARVGGELRIAQQALAET